VARVEQLAHHGSAERPGSAADENRHVRPL
jgi:hypothetical protein